VSSVDSFMFSTGVHPVPTIHKSHTPDPGALRAPRLLDNTPLPEAAGQEGEGPPSAQPLAVVSLSHPLALENREAADNSPKQRRWVSMAHSVLGIRSIQQELLIKQ
jgi:hyperosmotically inducible protein